MNSAASPTIFRWSTDDVPVEQRFAYFEDAVSSALTPMSVSGTPGQTFDAHFDMGQVGALTILNMYGDPSEARRTARDVSRSGAHSFHLLVNRTSPWKIEHLSRMSLAAGDAVLTDSSYEHWLYYGSRYDVVNVKLSESWLRQWLPHPGVLVGRRIPFNSRWGASLSAFLAQLSPELAVSSPVPGSVVSDHLGALLSLIANEFVMPPAQSRASVDLSTRLRDLIRQQCEDPMTDATGLAAALGISTRTLHRCLAAQGLTLGRELQRARVERAVDLLRSPIHRRLTLAEIGRRAGFTEPSHFARVMRSQCGMTPSQVRRSAELPAAEVEENRDGTN